MSQEPMIEAADSRYSVPAIDELLLGCQPLGDLGVERVHLFLAVFNVGQQLAQDQLLMRLDYSLEGPAQLGHLLRRTHGLIRPARWDPSPRAEYGPTYRWR